jgi:hypothetical protein
MKDLTSKRQVEIRRDYQILRTEGLNRKEAFEKLGTKYFLAPETIRLNVYRAGGYASDPKVEAKINMPKV